MRAMHIACAAGLAMLTFAITLVLEEWKPIRYEDQEDNAQAYLLQAGTNEDAAANSKNQCHIDHDRCASATRADLPTCSLPMDSGSTRLCMDGLHCLQKDGYAVIQNFLNSSERATLLQVVADRARFLANNNLNSADIQWWPHDIWLDPEEHVPPEFRHRLELLLLDIQRETDIGADMLWPGPVNFITPEHNPSVSEKTVLWHVDGEGYFMGEQAYHNIHLDLVLEKSAPECGNIEFVPFHTLKLKDPDLHREVLDRGGKSVFVRDTTKGVSKASLFTEAPLGTQTVHVDQVDFGRRTFSAVKLNDISHAPLLKAGDLLIFRSDTIHRTQHPGGWQGLNRISLQLRARRGRDVVDVAHTLLAGGTGKFRGISTEERKFQPDAHVLGLITALGKTPWRATWSEIRALSKAVRDCYSQQEGVVCSLSWYDLVWKDFWTALYKVCFHLSYARRRLERWMAL